MAQRRKATTYGKASRKPMIAREAAFTQAAGTDIWSPHDQHEDWRDDSLFTSAYPGNSGASDTISKNLGQGESSQVSQTESHSESNSSKHKHYSSLTPSISSMDDGVFDVPSSDDDIRSKVSATDRLARKKRKLTPNLVADDLPSVFDDASLQRHIAAEIQRELSSTRRPYSNAASSKSPPSPLPRIKRQDNEWPSKPPKQNWTLEMAGTRKEGSPHAVKPRNDKAKVKTTARPKATFQVEAINPSKPPRKTQKTEERLPEISGRITAYPKDTVHVMAVQPPKFPQKTKKFDENLSGIDVRPKTPKSTAKATLVHQSGGTNRERPHSMEEPYQPRTPSRPTQTTDEATTPRQRELWNKLLSDDVHTASPNNLNLPGLMLSDKKTTPPKEPPTARKVTWPKDQDASFKPRHKRLVDTLYPFDHGHVQSDEEVTDDDPENSSNDDCSRSQQSESSVINDALTVQTSPSAESQSRGQTLHQHNSSQSAQAIPTLHGVGPKVTYARQRSYLTDHDLDEAAMVSMPVVPAPTSKNGTSRRRLGDRFHGLQSTSIYDDDDNGAAEHSQAGAMRSIHELREAGGNVRLVGELEALLDELEEQDPITTTLMRSRMIDLIAKLLEPSTCRLFIDQGLESRLLAHVASLGDDLVSNSLFAAAILELISGSTSSLLLAQISDIRIMEFLTGLLGHDEDLASTSKLRSTNLSKVAQLEYQRLCTLLLKSTAWKIEKPTQLSCHVLALQCLEYVVRQTREAGSSVEVLSAYAIQHIIATSFPFPSTPLPLPTPTLTTNLELAVSILETCTISSAAECQQSLWSGGTLKRVTTLLPLLVSWSEEDCATSRTLTLRLYMNLTNNNPGLCEDFSTPGIVEALFRIIIVNFDQLSDCAITIDKALLLDHLILSLGSFINLAESSDIVRKFALTLNHGDRSYLDALLALFMTKSKSAAEVYSEEEASSNVALGYLSVLISFLCLNDAVKAHVSARLRGGTLKELVDAVEEFLQYHKQIDREICRGEGEDDPRAGFSGRLQGLVDELKA